MSFWTDAAVLGSAGIPSVLFGPGGAGLHSVEEYVEVQDVLRCRDALAALARGWCAVDSRRAASAACAAALRAVTCSGGLAQHEALRHQQVTARVAFEALARSAAADLPARRVVAARRAAHVHALAFEVQHRVVAAQPAEQLAEARASRGPSALAGSVVRDLPRSP